MSNDERLAELVFDIPLQDLSDLQKEKLEQIKNLNSSNRNTFNMLWDMVNDITDPYGGRKSSTGTIIGRYAGIIDDRINNSGHSRSVDSLKLYSDEQLQDELNERESENENGAL